MVRVSKQKPKALNRKPDKTRLASSGPQLVGRYRDTNTTIERWKCATDRAIATFVIMIDTNFAFDPVGVNIQH